MYTAVVVIKTVHWIGDHHVMALNSSTTSTVPRLVHFVCSISFHLYHSVIVIRIDPLATTLLRQVGNVFILMTQADGSFVAML